MFTWKPKCQWLNIRVNFFEDMCRPNRLTPCMLQSPHGQICRPNLRPCCQRIKVTFSHLGKYKGKGLDTCYSATYMSQTRDYIDRRISESDSWPAALYNLGSGSWLAWANGAAAHYVANQRTIGPTVQLADTPSPQSATLGLHPIAVATTRFPSR